MKPKIYFAGGWFTPEQEEEHERVYQALAKTNEFDIFNPKHHSFKPENATEDNMTATLLGNVENIAKADIVVAIYDRKDTGTIWETGFAYACKKPIIYYAETLGNKPFNLMLAKTGNFAANEADLIDMLLQKETYEFKSVYKYSGVIE